MIAEDGANRKVLIIGWLLFEVEWRNLRSEREPLPPASAVVFGASAKLFSFGKVRETRTDVMGGFEFVDLTPALTSYRLNVLV
jgi:hypothetical protein